VYSQPEPLPPFRHSAVHLSAICRKQFRRESHCADDSLVLAHFSVLYGNFVQGVDSLRKRFRVHVGRTSKPRARHIIPFSGKSRQTFAVGLFTPFPARSVGAEE
jgi:hypothetical protein